jgi:hypothetical protein
MHPHLNSTAKRRKQHGADQRVITLFLPAGIFPVLFLVSSLILLTVLRVAIVIIRVPIGSVCAIS